MRRVFGYVFMAVALSGCYHATIDTGRPASSTVIQIDWAHGFIFGLVPPATVETASTCPNGVAKVETQHSFLNLLAQFITFSLYTPITITVTCASAGRGSIDGAKSIEVGSDAAAAIAKAAEIFRETGQPVYVRF
jgi:hypothetical protein